MTRPSTDISPRDISRVLFRHKKKMAIWFTAVVAGAVALKALSPPAYLSECKLLVRLGRENVALDPTASLGEGPIMAAPHTREEEINSIVEILKSRFLLESLVDHFGAEAILADAPAPIRGSRVDQPNEGDEPLSGPNETANASDEFRQTVTEFRQRLSPTLSVRELALAQVEESLEVEGVEKSNLISLRYRAATPEASQAVIAKLVDLYLDHHVQMHRTAGARQFFAEQAEAMQAELQTASDELRRLKNETHVASLEEQRQVLLARIGSLREQRLLSQAELVAAEANVAFLTDRLRDLPEQVETARVNGFSGPAAALRHQLQAIESQEESGEDVSAEDLRRRRQRVQEAMADLGPSSVQVTTGVNRAHEEARLTLFSEQARAATLQAKVEMLGTHLAEADQELRRLNDAEARLVDLQRELELKDANYRKYAASLEQARIDEALKLERISNISMAQPPTLEDRPAGRSLRWTLAVALAVGAVGAVALAFFAERLDQSLKTSQDVEERLNLPVLVSIPRLPRSRIGLNGARTDTTDTRLQND